MKFTKTSIDGVFVAEPVVYSDHRGFFMESWSNRDFEAAGVSCCFVQDNHSYSARKGTVRGIHFQRKPHEQAKLLRCVRGCVLDVAVDLRPHSPTFLKWVGVELSAENKKQLFIPRGCGHGFVTLSDDVEFLYKADNYYAPESEGCIRWNDPELAIDWGVENPIISPKDANAPFLKDIVMKFKEN